MAYNPAKPADNDYLASFPPEMREQLRAIIEDMIVNAEKLKGLEPGNTSGKIPVSNGTKCTNLNAEMLNGLLASAFALAGHIHSVATGSSNGFMSNTDKTKLDSVAAGAEVNQNAFSNVKIGATTIQADSKTDTLEVVAGSGITLTPDATNDKLTIAVTIATILANAALTGTPTAPTASQATNSTQIATTAFVKAAIANLINSAPGALDTLNELATALGNDPNFATTVTNALAQKQPLDATLTAIAALTTAADKLIYATGSDAFATTTLSAFMRTLLDDADAATARNTLGAAATSHGTHVPAGGTNSTFLRGDLTWQSITILGGIVAYSLGVNGHVKFGCGLILQWANYASTDITSNPATFTFPLAFPYACVGVFLNRHVSSEHSYTTNGWTNTTFTLQRASGIGTSNFNMFAIGY